MSVEILSANPTADADVLIDSIIIDRADRQRKTIDVENLVPSIKQWGLIQPIVIDRGLKLIAGERRLTACKQLGWALIPVRFRENMSKLEGMILEFEENSKREDLPWQDNCQAVANIHQAYLAENEDWTITKTAGVLSLTQGWVSTYLLVQKTIDDPRIATAGTVREAWNILQRRSQREAGDELQDLLRPATPQAVDLPALATALGIPSITLPAALPMDSISGALADFSKVWDGKVLPQKPEREIPPPPQAVIQNVSFLDWAPLYTGEKFNFLHCDFPYGIDLFSGEQARGAEPQEGYADGEEVYWKLLDCLCDNFSKFMSISSHMIFWYSEKNGDKTKAIFKARLPDLKFTPFPLIYHKTDNAGIIGDHRRHPRHIYETALFASWGGRQILQSVGDAYGCPSDRKFHPSTKPEPMLKHFFRMIVDETTTLLDPTCGGGTAIRAGFALGAKRLLGLEIDPLHAKVAGEQFEVAKLKSVLAERV